MKAGVEFSVLSSTSSAADNCVLGTRSLSPLLPYPCSLLPPVVSPAFVLVYLPPVARDYLRVALVCTEGDWDVSSPVRLVCSSDSSCN